MTSRRPKTLFGAELERLWLAAGYKNRAAFLRAAGLENPTVHRWETRDDLIPREDLLERAARALRVHIGLLQDLHRRSRSAAGNGRPTAADPSQPAVSEPIAPYVPLPPLPHGRDEAERWTGVYLRARGIVQPERVSAVRERIERAAGPSGPTPELVEEIVDLVLELERHADDGAPAPSPHGVVSLKPRRRRRRSG